MAGPVAHVLLPVPITAEVEAIIRHDLVQLSDQIEGDDFWVQRRPFLLGHDPSDVATETLATCTGWAVQGVISLDAMCNEDLDHRLLGEMCLLFARKFGGWIDFCGELCPWITDLRSLPGGICRHSYVSISERECIAHLCDAEFLEAWLRRPDFHMIK